MHLRVILKSLNYPFNIKLINNNIFTHKKYYTFLLSCLRDPPSLAPTDTGSGYKQPKAKIGRSKVRQWKWMEFSNSARNDDLVLYHWRRKVEEGKEYPFAEFGKVCKYGIHSTLSGMYFQSIAKLVLGFVDINVLCLV